MKKILLLCSIMMMYCFSIHAQVFLKATPTTVVSGNDVTISPTGSEFPNNYIALLGFGLDAGTATIIDYTVKSQSTYNKATSAATKAVITFKFKNPNANQPFTFLLTYSETYNNDIVNTQNQMTTTIQITINPVPIGPTVYNNEPQSRIFYNNTCAAGYMSDPYNYIVPANKYQSNISVNDANAKAIADINTKGQGVANANAPCKMIYHNNNTPSVTLPRNNCGVGSNGSSVTFTIQPNTQSSLISVDDANQKAVAAAQAGAQAYANANGTCSQVTFTRLEYTNPVTTNTGFEIQKGANLTIKFYQDVACTQPLLITTPLNVLITQTDVRSGSTLDPNGTTTYSNTYSVSAGVNSYSLGYRNLNVTAGTSSSGGHGPDGGGGGSSGTHGTLSSTFTIQGNNNTYYPVSSTPPNF